MTEEAVPSDQISVDPLIKEAVCQFRYTSDGPWDLTNIGTLYGLIKDEYRIKRPVKQADLVFEIKNGVPSTTQRMVDLMQFRKEDETGVVSVGGDQLSISSLTNYMGWLNFKKEILNIFELWDHLETEDNLLTRIGLRYINVIPHTAKSNASEYLKHKLPLQNENFDQSEFIYQSIVNITDFADSETGVSQVKVIISNNANVPGKLLMDIEASIRNMHDSSESEDNLSVKKIDEYIEVLHKNVKKIFIDIIESKVIEEFSLDIKESD